MNNGNENHIINWKGKEYIEYQKWKQECNRIDTKPIVAWMRKYRHMLLCFASAIVIGIASDSVTWQTPTPLSPEYKAWLVIIILAVGLSVGLAVHGIALIRSR